MSAGHQPMTEARSGWPERALLLLLLLLLLLPAAGWAAAAESAPSLDVAVRSADDTLDVGRIAAPAEAERFIDVPDRSVRVVTGAGEQLWLRLRTTLPATADGAEPLHWVLQFERASIERVQFHLPLDDVGYRRIDDGFFAPAVGGLRSHFAVRLPHRAGPVEMYVALKSRAQVQVVPEIVDEASFDVHDRLAGNLGAAVYAALLVIALSALALSIALRERYFLSFAGFAAVLLLLMLTMSGHLPALPGGRWLGAAGKYGLLLGLGLLAAAAALDFTRRFLDLDGRAPGWARAARGMLWLTLATAVLAPLQLVPALLTQRLAFGLLAVVMIGLVVLSARCWRRGERWAAATTVLWLVFGWSVGLRIAVALQWVSPGFWSMHGYQLVLAGCLFLFSMLLTGRIMEFRQQRDRVHLLHEQTDADLQIEQRRRQFSEALQETLRNAVAPGDLEWRAFKQLSQTIAGMLPHRAIAVTVTGYRGFDFLLTEPMNAKLRYCNLLAARAATLKGICRSRSPVQLKLELAAPADGGSTEQAMFAVVPMAIPRPGWGALLVERLPDQGFEPRELALAAEFVAMALAAAEEGALKAELRRTADVDPLTGVLNRRAGDERLEQLFRRTLSERQPLALLFADLDHFKQVNDRHGHAAGDECLRALANAIRPHIGAEDLLIRYGGEEFLVVLPQRTIEQAREVGERIRLQVAALRVHAGDTLIKLTVSIGVAARLPNDDRPQSLVDRADRALYTAKRNGRNQVQLASAFAGHGEPAGIPPVY